MTVSSAAGRAETSAALFNNRHLIAVVGAIARSRHADGGFTTRSIAVATELPDSLVRPVTLRLLTAGLLEEGERLPGSRGARYFNVAQQKAWRELEALCRTLSHEDPQRRLRNS